MQLRKCNKCEKYTLKEICNKCDSKTIDAHYKFKQLRDAPKDSAKHFTKIRKNKRLKTKPNCQNNNFLLIVFFMK